MGVFLSKPLYFFFYFFYFFYLPSFIYLLLSANLHLTRGKRVVFFNCFTRVNSGAWEFHSTRSKISSKINKPLPHSRSGSGWLKSWLLLALSSSLLQWRPQSHLGLKPEPWSEMTHQYSSLIAEKRTQTFLLGSNLLPCFAAFTNASWSPSRISACHAAGMSASNSSNIGPRYRVEAKPIVTQFCFTGRDDIAIT